MTKRYRGFFLFAFLIVLNLILLLVLKHRQVVFLHLKTTNTFNQQFELFQQLEKESNHLINNHWKPACIIQGADPNSLVDRVKNKEGCSYNKKGLRYTYLIEELGEFPCIKMTISNLVYSTKHKRLTIAVGTAPPKVLQLRLAYPMMNQPCDREQFTFIKDTLLSWRML